MAKRRQNGEGTIYQRPNGLWVCDVTLGYDENRKRIRKTLSSMDLNKLKKKLNDIKYLNDRNLVSEPSEYTVSEWLDFWLENYKRRSVKPTTYDMYYNAVTKYLKPYLGHYKLEKLNGIAVQKFINDISEKGCCKDAGLSLSSMKKVLITLSQAYEQAIKLGMLFQNPCKNIELPKKDAKKAVAFTKEEQSVFLELCDGGTTFQNLFIFAFNTGMRMGEILALTWDDVDLTEGTIKINKNISVVREYDENAERKQKTIINTSTKNGTERTIPMTKAAALAVSRQKEKNKTNSPFIFCSSKGTPLQKRNIYRAFDDIVQTSEIKSPVTFHSFRHSFATRLLEKGADIKTVSNLLGHKSVQITLDIYSHVSADLKKQTISLLEEN